MSESYSLPPMLRTIDDYSESTTSWEDYKIQFAKADSTRRVTELRKVDAWLSEYDRPTRDLSTTLQARRELLDLHQTLSRAGR